MRHENDEHEDDRTAINIATAILLAACIATAIAMSVAPAEPELPKVLYFTEGTK